MSKEAIIFNLRNDQSPAMIVELLCGVAVHYPDLREDIHELITNAKAGVRIEIIPQKSSRTREQEAYYRKWCRAFAEFCGLSADEMHEEMLMLCYGSEEHDTLFGPRRRPIKRSGDTSKETYSALLDTLIDTAAQFNYQIPPPHNNRRDEDDD